uniref:WAT1-related protein At5g64700-like n=1 Tax=Erigeron canadensis TaxID=72917 RepID=UPI001CB994DB|nr:WAT1-related protein At5g64700-like [Erigeron canadensis]
MKTNMLPYLAMVFVQFLFSGASITMKIGFANGLHQLVFMVYRHIVSTILFCPFAYAFERKERPALTFVVILKIFVMSLIGSTIHLNAFSYGLTYTSPTVASALNCLTPSLTFLIAFLLRMEKVKITSSKGQAKVLGTLISMAGTLVITFWRGGFQINGILKKPLINIYNSNGLSGHVKQNWVKGATLISTSKVAWSLWLIFQGLIHKEYPAPISINFMVCLFASLQSSFLAIFFARDATLWKLEWDASLLTIIYGGLVVSGLSYYLVLWSISKRGPVFAAMFSPLQVPIVGIFSAIVFKERLHIGSFIGALIIIFGLYCVLWGKSGNNSSDLDKKINDVENDDKASEMVNNNDKDATKHSNKTEP